MGTKKEKPEGVETSNTEDSQVRMVALRLKREELLAEDTKLIPDLQDRALRDFFKALALAPHIRGVALSRMHRGGVYTNVFVRNLTDSQGMTRAHNVLNWRLLESATGKSAGYYDYISIDEQNDTEFIDWFKKEYHEPVDGTAEEAFFGSLKGSGDEMDLLGIIMFED